MKMPLNERILRFLLSSSLCLLVTFGAWCQGAKETKKDDKDAKEDNGFVLDKIICKVDNYIVLKSELEAAYQNYVTEGNAGSEQARCGLLNRLVMSKLMVAKAEIDSIVVTDGEVDKNTTQRMAVILQNYGNSAEELERRYVMKRDQIKIDHRVHIGEELLV